MPGFGEAEVRNLTKVIEIFDGRGWGHYEEHQMLALMENLQDCAPIKLSHAGPRKCAYHDLS